MYQVGPTEGGLRGVDATDRPALAPVPDVDGPVDGPVDEATHLDRLQTIFHAAPVGIGIVHPDGHLLMSNETLRLMLGYSAEEFAQMPWSAYTHRDDVPHNLELNRQMAAGDIDGFTLEKRFICKDGRELWAELTSSMVRDATGAPDYLIGMVQDISDRKRLESELRAAEGQHRQLVERVPATVYIADAGEDGRWHYVSPQVEEMLGFTPAEWMADTGLWLRQVHPDDRAVAMAADEPRPRPRARTRASRPPTGCCTATAASSGSVTTRSACSRETGSPGTGCSWRSRARSSSRSGSRTRRSTTR